MKDILRVIRDGGLLSKGDIANKVGIQESTLDSILSPFLERLPENDR